MGPAVPVRRRSSSTGGASATGWPSCAARSPRWSRPATPSGPERRRTRCRRSRSPATPTPASPRCSTGSPARGRARRERAVRHARPDRPPGRDRRRPHVYTLADTVGFVRQLPHQLVEAFRSTLEEVADADLILHVVDGSHPDPEGQIAAVRAVFADIGAPSTCPRSSSLNKADVADPEVVARLRPRERHSSSSPRTRRGHRGAAGGDRRRAAAAPASASTCSSRTTAATWSAACTRTVTSRSRSTAGGHEGARAGDRGAGRRARGVRRARPAEPRRPAGTAPTPSGASAPVTRR